MEELIESFKKSLFETSVEGILNESEFIVDNLLDNEVIKSIPIANVILGICKTTKNLYDYNLLKQTYNFLETFNAKKINPKKLEKYKKKINENNNFEKKEIGRILMILNGIIDDEKSKLLAKFYRAYVNEEITWDKFCEFSDVITRIFVSDIPTVFEIYKEIKNVEASVIAYDKYRTDRLIAIGLLSTNSKGLTVADINGNERENFERNGLGELFVRIAKRD